MFKKIIVVFLFFFTMNAFSAGIDLKKSWLRWKGDKVTGSHFGPLQFKKGHLDVKEGLIKGGEFVVDMNSIDCEDMEGKWKKKLLAHLKSDDFFSVKKFATSRLKLLSSQKLEKGGLKVKALLTIKGVERPVSFIAKRLGNKYVGDLTFDRTTYDIKYKSGSFFKELGDKMIYDNVKLSFSIQFKK